jgi:hypothetical protein
MLRHLLTSLSVACLLATVSAQRFVRFIGTDGMEHFGDAILPSNTTDARFAKTARLITGDILGDYTITNTTVVCALTHPCSFYLTPSTEYRIFTFTSSQRTRSNCSMRWIQLVC